MAIQPKVNYPGKIDTTDPNYPEGKARNVTAPGDGTGTPWEAAVVNDIFGFQQKLLKASGIAPSGAPDDTANSDYFDALNKLFDRYSAFVDTGAANVIALAAVSGADPDAYADGQQVSFFLNTTITGAATIEIAALGAEAFTDVNGGALTNGKLRAGDSVQAVYDLANTRFELQERKPLLGSVVNRAYFQDGGVNTGATLMVHDDTIPQVTEGNLFMTLPPYTPKSATNILKIEVLVHGAHTSAAGVRLIAAIFKDAAANAIATGNDFSSVIDVLHNIPLSTEIVAGGVAPISFTVRAGGNLAGTFTFNGEAGIGKYGGTLFSYIKITEYEAL